MVPPMLRNVYNINIRQRDLYKTLINSVPGLTIMMPFDVIIGYYLQVSTIALYRYVRLFTSHLHLFKRISNPTVPRARARGDIPPSSLSILRDRFPGQGGGKRKQEVNRETGRSCYLSLECV